MKAVLLRYVPAAQLIDVTHAIPPQDVVAGAIALERAVAAFGAGTTHLAVVDPGVGTQRRILIAQVKDQILVCPDNGLITWMWHRHGQEGRALRCYELLWRPGRFSATFHGRDIMAPAAGMLAAGKPIESVARPVTDPILLDLVPAEPTSPRGRIIHIDHFGNATTNVPQEHPLLRQGADIRIRGRSLGSLRSTYQDVGEGQPLGLIGSSELLEIAVRNGSAAEVLHLSVGDAVELVWTGA